MGWLQGPWTFQKIIRALIILFAFIAGILLISGYGSRPAATPTTAQRAQVTPPPPSASELVAAQNSRGFQLVVSYANSGFQPSSATVKVGDTVRFTNTSANSLWIASIENASGKLYPGDSDCGGSVLDSCGPITFGHYWEFTFTQKGTWELMNNYDKSHTVSVTVQ